MKLWTKQKRVMLGLSDKEYVLMEVLFRHGPQNTSALAYRASLPRVTAMRFLRKLKERGFVSREIKTREVVWLLTDPSVIERRAAQLFAEGNRSYDIRLSEVGVLTVYHGAEKMLMGSEKMLAARPGERILVIEPNGIWKHFFNMSSKTWADLNTSLKRNGVLVELVFEEGFQKQLSALDPTVRESLLALSVDTRVVPAGFLDSATEINIFRDQVLFLDWAHLVAVEIKNPSTVRVIKAMFHLLQQSGRPLS